MKRQYLPGYAIALAVLVVGLVAAGVEISTLLVVLIALTCPLMMLFMMSGMDHGTGHDGATPPTNADRPRGERTPTKEKTKWTS